MVPQTSLFHPHMCIDIQDFKKSSARECCFYNTDNTYFADSYIEPRVTSFVTQFFCLNNQIFQWTALENLIHFFKTKHCNKRHVSSQTWMCSSWNEWSSSGPKQKVDLFQCTLELSFSILLVYLSRIMIKSVWSHRSAISEVHQGIEGKNIGEYQ